MAVKKIGKKWRAQAYIDGHTVHVGMFKTKHEAREAVEDAKRHNRYTFYEGEIDPLTDNIKPRLWQKIKKYFNRVKDKNRPS